MFASLSLIAGGFLCGALAGCSVQFGRLCTFSAIEDAVMAADYRRARAFMLALATALLTTQVLVLGHVIDLSGNPYSRSELELAGLAVGAFLFGNGMALVGTCGFGLLVRAGTGDLRAAICAGTLGIAAAAATGGLLSVPRLWLSRALVLPADATGWDAISGFSQARLGIAAEGPLAVAAAGALLGVVLSSRTFRRRWRLLAGGIGLGLAVTAGWIVTAGLADPFGTQRPESLTFVGPLARSILITMGETISSAAFAVATVPGVIAGSMVVALARDEFRWEAFDDHREMKRHLLGTVLMGFGGVLAKGCTIGQGLSAASTLAVTAPIAIVFIVLGSWVGISRLVGGWADDPGEAFD